MGVVRVFLLAKEEGGGGSGASVVRVWGFTLFLILPPLMRDAGGFGWALG